MKEIVILFNGFKTINTSRIHGILSPLSIG
jgi:hypothetical protein